MVTSSNFESSSESSSEFLSGPGVTRDLPEPGPGFKFVQRKKVGTLHLLLIARKRALGWGTIETNVCAATMRQCASLKSAAIQSHDRPAESSSALACPRTGLLARRAKVVERRGSVLTRIYS